MYTATISLALGALRISASDPVLYIALWSVLREFFRKLDVSPPSLVLSNGSENQAYYFRQFDDVFMISGETDEDNWLPKKLYFFKSDVMSSQDPIFQISSAKSSQKYKVSFGNLHSSLIERGDDLEKMMWSLLKKARRENQADGRQAFEFPGTGVAHFTITKLDEKGADRHSSYLLEPAGRGVFEIVFDPEINETRHSVLPKTYRFRTRDLDFDDPSFN
jgi:hypothetical protein